MRSLGLTGGIGMGKSACADLLRQRGIQVIDTDLLAREVVEPGQPALYEIQETFGSQIIRPDGHLDREQLARLVFSDSTARQRLEQILHPRIRHLWKTQVEALLGPPSPVHAPRSWPARLGPLLAPRPTPFAVVVIPLLFETNAQTEFDATICVACTSTTQHERLRARGWSDSQIDQRIKAQLPIGEKTRLADFVIWTEDGFVVHAQQLDRILDTFR